MPEERVIFNREVALDLFWLDGRAVLHVVDVDTGYSNADFLDGNTEEDVWRKFVDIWATVYVGFPTSMKVDQGSQFQAVRWEKRATDSGIVLKSTGVESHNSMGVGERYHGPLRRIFVKVRTVSPGLSSHHALRLAVKTMDDTAGPNGLVPSLLVFGVLPRYPASATSFPDQRARMLAITTARLEYQKVVADLRIRQAINSCIPAAANYIIYPGDYVYVYRETDRRYHKLRVVKVEDEHLYVLREGKEVQHNISQVISAWEMELTVSGRSPPPACSNPDNGGNSDTLDTGKPGEEGAEKTAMITETLPIGDIRSRLPEFEEAKRREIEGLEERGAWEEVNAKDVPADANVIGGRFVLAIKEKDTDHPKYKARFAAQGHRDSQLDFLVHSSTTASAVSVRILALVAVQFGFKLWSSDVKQAYLQSRHQLKRSVFIRPPKELNYKQDVLLKLKRPLYGLCDAGDYWYNTFRGHLEGDLGMRRTAADPSLFYLQDYAGRLVGLTATYVDDTLNAGNDDFVKTSDETSHLFESRSRKFDNIQFAGVQMEVHVCYVALHQRRHYSQVQVLESTCEFSSFKSMLMIAAWVVQTRPDIACAVAQLAQVTPDRYNQRREEYVRLLNRVIRHITRATDVGIRIPILGRTSLHLRVYADGAFANNEDSSSQLGCIIALCDNDGNCAVLVFKSYKSRRVVASVLEAETGAMVEAVNHGIALKRDLEVLLGQEISVKAFTDSMSLFDVISRGASTRNKRLMIDIRQLHQSYERFELYSINHIRTNFNPADVMTKVGSNDVLRAIVMEGRVVHPISLSITRSDSGEPISHDGETASVGEELLDEWRRDEEVAQVHQDRLEN